MKGRGNVIGSGNNCMDSKHRLWVGIYHRRGLGQRSLVWHDKRLWVGTCTAEGWGGVDWVTECWVLNLDHGRGLSKKKSLVQLSYAQWCHLKDVLICF